MFAFLHIVLYIPNPIMIEANITRGINMKKFVLRPINYNNI